MEFASSKIINYVIRYLNIADLAYFSLVSKSIRQYTQQQKVIDVSNIIYSYSKNEFVSILKILRFHQFSHWILSESHLLNDPEIAHIIANMMQSRFKSSELSSLKHTNMVKHVTFKSLLPCISLDDDRIESMKEKNEIIQCLSHLQLHHINTSTNIPCSVLKSSYKSLISISSSNKNISKCLNEVNCFDNLETLIIEHHTINDQPLQLGHGFDSPFISFCKLKQLTLKRQCIATSFKRLCCVINLFIPTLTHCSIIHCVFTEEDKLFTLSKSLFHMTLGVQIPQSNRVQSLYFNGISLERGRLCNIAYYFGESLEYIQFYQCSLPKLPTDEANWTYFVSRCTCLKSIVCNTLCNSVKNRFNNKLGRFLIDCKQHKSDIVQYVEDISLNYFLKRTYGNKKNVSIIFIKNKPKSIQKKTKEDYFTIGNYCYYSYWKSPKRFIKCNLCGSNVADGFMNDHLNSICYNQIIQCNLCKINIKRCELTNHWNNGCNGYEYICSQCLITFKDRHKYYQHIIDHSKYRDEFCHCKSIELAWKCLNCQQRELCMGSKQKHECYSYGKYDRSLSLLRCVIPSLLIVSWIKIEIQNKYKLYSDITIGVLHLIEKFYAKKTDWALCHVKSKFGWKGPNGLHVLSRDCRLQYLYDKQMKHNLLSFIVCADIKCNWHFTKIVKILQFDGFSWNEIYNAYIGWRGRDIWGEELGTYIILKRKPSPQDIVLINSGVDLITRQIMPEDAEVITELKYIAKNHKHMESAVNDLSQRLPFEDETSKNVAETMMKHINDTQDDINLLFTTSAHDSSLDN
eukprot:507424_1